MSNTSTTTVSGGIGLPTALTLIFITLKLIPDSNGHIIDWSWWWVLSPIWISWLIIIAIILLMFIGTVLMALIGFRKR